MSYKKKRKKKFTNDQSDTFKNDRLNCIKKNTFNLILFFMNSFITYLGYILFFSYYYDFLIIH